MIFQPGSLDSRCIVQRKKRPTDIDQLAAYTVRLLESEFEPYGERALNPSRHQAWEVRNDLLTAMDHLLQERLVDRIYETRPRMGPR